MSKKKNEFNLLQSKKVQEKIYFKTEKVNPRQSKI